MEKYTKWWLPLPVRIAPFIFSKLSIFNLPTCRLVSKSWNLLVLDYADSSPKLHLPNEFLFTTVDYDPYSTRSPVISFHNPMIYCFDIHTMSFFASCTLGLDVNCIGIYGSCNGLLFIDRGNSDSAYEGIFNPMTNEFFPTPCHNELHYLYHGFGFSPETKLYKLFRADGHILKILRFDRNSNQWTSVYLTPPVTLQSHGVYRDGTIYWIGKEKEYLIYALDVETEKFEVVLELDPYSHCPVLQQSNGTIYAIVFMSKPSQIQVWNMQTKDSWIRDFIVPYAFIDIDTNFDFLKASNGKMLVRIINDLFCLDNSGKKKIKTLIPYNRRFISNCLVESFHFGSLPAILAGHHSRSGEKCCSDL